MSVTLQKDNCFWKILFIPWIFILLYFLILFRSEWIYLRAMSHVRSLNSALYFSSGKVVMLGTFVVWMFFNSYVKGSVLFTTLALFEVLRAIVGLLMPWGIRFFAEAIAATKRIEVGSSFGIRSSYNFKSIAFRFTVILFQSSIPIQKVKKSTAFFHRDNKIRDTIHETFKGTLCRKLANTNK